jgi:hypothetical protein
MARPDNHKERNAAKRTSASPVTRDAAIEKVRLAEALPAPRYTQWLCRSGSESPAMVEPARRPPRLLLRSAAPIRITARSKTSEAAMTVEII